MPRWRQSTRDRWRRWTGIWLPSGNVAPPATHTGRRPSSANSPANPAPSPESGALARQFASALLARLAGPEIEGRLVAIFVEELSALPEERLEPLRAGPNGHGQGVLSSAHPLSEEQRRQISGAVDARLGKLVHLDFVEDSELLAGVRLSLGAWQLDLSLAGELGVFAEAGRLDH